jgi:1-acyl-sn-glycerol-3-phosphate acyltransferase
MSFIYRLINILCVSIGILATFLYAIIAIPANLISRRYLGKHIHTLWGKTMCALMDIRIECKGLENIPKTGKVLASNHESVFDMFILSALGIEFIWVSKMQMKKIPLVGWNMMAMGCYFVKRNDPEYDRLVMQQVADDLKKGQSIFFFPEGTRTRTGQLQAFKKGAFKTAASANVPMIPIAIKGTYAIAPPGMIPHKRGHKVKVNIGKPYFIDPNITLDQNVENFRNNIIELLQE